MKKVYVTHGYTAHPDKHWFPWLERELAQLGIACVRLEMPDSSNPTPEAWLAYHQQQIEFDEETLFIGHSLGCIATLNYLAHTQQKAKAAIFVSGFYQKLPNLPELDAFANFYANSTACLPEKSYVIASLTDAVVHHRFSDQLAQHLGADYLRLPQGGHFLDREGVTELPELLALIKGILTHTV